ncbi:hypothetical protein [Streptomyces sp. NPDC005970]|uniref:hypothetical protein n=1 Tax=Streptomyces sp. NPDC005970 TaxID=3156723 RepID=UPI003410A258
MYLVYEPEGAEEPQRWKYNPKRLMSVEREDLERRTGRDYSDFAKGVMAGNSLCRRALLYTFLRREHPKTRWEDVDFAWDELKLEYSKSEYEHMRTEALANLHGDELAVALQQIDKELETAFDDTEESGKAGLPIVA